MRKIVVLAIALAVAATACGDSASADDGAPEPQAGPAFVEDVEFVFMESYPVQVQAIIRGSLPTPCHELVVEQPADPIVDITSTVDPEVVCAQVLEPFEVTVFIGSYESGEHVLTVNGTEYPFTI